jgi:hypothetical protein
MMMIVEQSVEWVLTGETEIFGENLPQPHFGHQKFHMTWPGIEPVPARLEAWAMARPNGVGVTLGVKEGKFCNG